MAKWKYSVASKRITDSVEHDQADLQKRLDEAGNEGKELAAVVQHPAGYLMMVFKKPA